MGWTASIPNGLAPFLGCRPSCDRVPSFVHLVRAACMAILKAWFQSSVAYTLVIVCHPLFTWLGLPAWLLTAWFQSSLAHHPVIVFHPLFTWLGLPAWLLTSRFQSSLAHHPVIVCHSLLSWKRCLCSSVMTWPHSPVVYIPSCDYVQSFVQLGRAVCTTS